MGQACDLALSENQGAGKWYNVSAGDPSFRARTAAAGAFLSSTGGLYIFGGEMSPCSVLLWGGRERDCPAGVCVETDALVFEI